MALPIFMGEVPIYSVRDGNMLITIGDLALAMPISVFLIGCVKGREAIAKWQVAEMAKSPKVVQLPRH